jgi:hypothetical protein
MKEALMDQRYVMESLGVVVLWSLKELYQSPERVTRVMQYLKNTGRRIVDQAGHPGPRNQVLTDLLGINGFVHVRPGNDHLYSPGAVVSPDIGAAGFPHDVKATNAICERLFAEPTIVTDEPFIKEEVQSTDSLLCVGSPVSNSFSRQFVPMMREEDCLHNSKHNAYQTAINPSRLPYHFLHGAKKEIKVYSGMNAGKLEPKFTHGIWIAEGRGQIHRPDGFVRNGWLEKDFILVSRLPRTTGGGEVLTIAGGHGAGTQAFELMFDPQALPLSELDALKSQLKGKRYYQFVLEASDITHVEGTMSVAWKLAVSKHLPVRIIENDVEALFAV